MKLRARGLVLGKFLPPHAGHLYLVDYARSYVDDLTVVVGTLKREPIPGELRYQWMSELCPGANVVHLTDENPQTPEEHPQFWDIWRESLTRVLKDPVEFVFASEDYGERLAKELGAKFIPVDIARAQVPISGTEVRARPLTHWEFLPPCVRAHYAVRVCVFGPESTGKSTLSQNLAKRYGTVNVAEYARAYLEKRNGKLEYDDLEFIGRGQCAAEDALAPRANRLLFCDTDLLTTRIWSEALFDRCPEWVHETAKLRHYQLYLLNDVDVPFVPDVVRYLPQEREAFFARCERALKEENRRYVVLRGSWENRFATACAAIDGLIESGRVE